MRKLIVLILACALLPSCAHTTYRNSTGKPISFTGNLGTGMKYEAVGHVNNDYRRQWLFWYLLPIGKDGTDMIAESVGGAEAMSNLKIKAVFDVVDVVLSNLSLGIYCSRLVNIQGDLMKSTGKP